MSSYRWIPWAIAGGLGVVVIVNGALAYFAVTSSTGLVTEHPYDDGNAYNHVLDAAAAQDALGWRGTLTYTPDGAEHGEIVAEFTDHTGQKLTGLAVTARLERPVEPLPEVMLALLEGKSGRYAGAVALTRPGQWEVHAAARRGNDTFEFAQRILVK
jgi:nitrogen fixation protein FixH